MPKGISFYAQRAGRWLRPVDAAGEEALERVPAGKVMKITVVQERSARRNAFFHLLCWRVANALQAMGRDWASKDYVKSRLTIAAGHYDTFELPDKTSVACPRSIRFAAMDDLEFSEFVDKAVRFICTDLLPHLPATYLREEIESLLDEEQRRAYNERKKA